MRCPSCGASREAEGCSECEPGFAKISEAELEEFNSRDSESDSDENSPQHESKKSILIEFPGVLRSTVPEWRRELSERVREVQERRAREALEEAAELQRTEATPDAQSPQLELLPQIAPTAVNPLVAAALKRIERANQPNSSDTTVPAPKVARAVACAQQTNFESGSEHAHVLEHEPIDTEIQKAPAEKAHNLVIVPPPAEPLKLSLALDDEIEAQPEPAPEGEPDPGPRTAPKRLISDNDPALNYLNAIPTTVRLEEIPNRRASIAARFTAATIDLVVSALLFSPIAAAIELTNGNWQQPRTITFAVATAAVVTFLYTMVATALAGRTLGMVLLSLRVVDKRTGLIPTGAQSTWRAIIYLLSLAALPLALLYPVLNREGHAFHDKLTGTVVIRA